MTQQVSPPPPTTAITSSLAVLLVLAIATSTVAAWRADSQAEVANTAYNQIADARKGVFNERVWRQKLKEVAALEVAAFQLDTPERRHAIAAMVDGRLRTVVPEEITHVWGMVRELFGGEAAGAQQDLSATAEMITEQIMLLEPDLKVALLDALTESLTSQQDTPAHELPNPQDLEVLQAASQETLARLGWLLLVLSACVASLLALLWYVASTRPPDGRRTPLLMVLVAAWGLLVPGVLLPTMSILSQFTELSLQLQSSEVRFGSQVVNYQSKSILGVADVLLAAPQAAPKIVGAFVLVFSILFPIVKLSAATLLLQAPGNRWCLRFQSLGRWSMADVFVVALLMAFIGMDSTQGAQFSHEALLGDFGTDATIRAGGVCFALFVVLSVAAGHVLRFAVVEAQRKS